MNATPQPRFARLAATIGDPTRAAMLARLLDGRHYTAKELADHAGVGAPTASQHLKLLVDERLARVRSQGRHRYFTLADANVAHALEALLLVADGGLPEATRWDKPGMRNLRHARSCYGHLAGSLGVALCQSFLKRGWVHATDGDRLDYQVTPAGIEALIQLGLPIAAGPDLARKRMLYGCMDWSERRDHFAGPLALLMLDAFIERNWLRRRDKSRELTVTPTGQARLVERLIGSDR